jgi:uroporphyrinogen-III synthase
MRVLITRPAADATELAAALRTHGHEVLFDPLLTTSEEPGSAAALERSLPGIQAVVFTSPNGVRAFAAASRRRNIPVIALGDATAAAARAANFGEIESVDGDAEALTALVVGRLNPLGGALLVVTGAEVGRDLARVLGAAGFSVRRVALYRAEPAQAFSSKVVAGFKSGTIDAAVFFSPGTATVFGRLVSASGFGSACEGITAVVTSPAVGSALKSIAWDNLVVARAPTQAAILEAFGNPMPQTRPGAAREDVRAGDHRAERVGESPMRSAGADAAVLEPPIGSPPPPPRLPPLRTETFTPRKKPAGRPIGPRVRSIAPMFLAVAALLAAVATSPYWAISLAAHLPWVAPGDSGVVLAKVNDINERLDALDQRLDKRLTELAATLERTSAAGAARATGIEDVTHRLDAALAEDSKRLDALDKGLTTLSTNVEGAKSAANARGASLEEQTRKLGAALGDHGKHLEGLDKGLVALSASTDSANTAAATRAANIEQQAQKLGTALTDQRSQLDALDKRLQGLIASTDTANTASLGRMNALEDQTRKLGTTLAGHTDRLAAIGTRVETLAIATDTANASTASLRDDTQKLGQALKAQSARVDTVSAATDAANAATLALKDEGQKLSAALKGQGERLDTALKGQGERLDGVSASADRANATAAQLGKDQQELAAALKGQGDRISAVSASTDAANAADKKLADEAQQLRASLAEHADRLAALATAADTANAAAASRAGALEEETRKLGASLTEQGARLAGVDKRLDALAAAGDTLNTAAAALGDDTRKLGASLADHGARLELVDRRLDTLAAAANSASASEASLGVDTRKMATVITDHTGRLAWLEKRLQAASDSDLTNVTASAQVARTQTLEETADRLNSEIAEQRARVDRLESTATALEGTTTALQDRTAALLDKTDVALSFAVGALRAGLATSRPFAAELQVAEGLAQQRPEALTALRSLDERAARGIPSLAALVYRFGAVARDVRRDEAAKRASESAAGGVMGKLQEIVIGRPGDPNAVPEPTGAEAALAATEAALKREDLAAATSALKQLEASAADSVGLWIREAEARLAAESTLAGLDTQLARRLRESAFAPATTP